MKMDLKRVTLSDLLDACLGISAILALSPYFMWKQYSATARSLGNAFVFFTLALTILYLTIDRSKRRSRLDWAMLGLLFSFWLINRFHTWNGSIDLSISSIISILTILAFLALRDDDKASAYRVFKIAFAVLLVPGIFVFLARLINVSLPNSALESANQVKASAGFYYHQYFLALFMDNSRFSVKLNTYRLCGVFDEPGVIGTISALLLAGGEFKKNRFVNGILLIGGIMSLSFAFFLLVGLTVFLRQLRNGLSLKLVAKIAVSIFLIAIIFSRVSGNLALDYFYLDRANKFLNGEDNRTSNDYQDAFSGFLRSGDALLGHGEGAKNNSEAMMGSSSYRDLIFNYGIVGFAFYVGWILAFSLKKSRRDKRCIALAALFCLSIYQRPEVLTLPFLIILFGGIANIMPGEALSPRLRWKAQAWRIHRRDRTLGLGLDQGWKIKPKRGIYESPVGLDTGPRVQPRTLRRARSR